MGSKMSKNKESVLSSQELENWVAQGKMPPNLDEPGLAHLEKMIQQITEIQKSKKKGASQEDLLSLLNTDHEKTNFEEVEKGLAFYRYVIENKDILKRVITGDKKKFSKFRQSGHLTDQTLKYSDPNKQQLSLFDSLDIETEEKIKKSEIEIKAEGIRLSPAEDKILKALSRLVHEKSGNLLNNPQNSLSNKDPNFQMSSYGGKEQQAMAPVLKISPAELYKAYLDRNDYSGEEIKFIKKTLYDLSQKKFLIIYDRKRQEKGKKVTDRIEDFQNLIKIMSYIEGLSDTELKKLDEGDTVIREKRGELIIGLNPIFIDQISTKYIEYPSDINKRTTIAAGGHKSVTESMIILRDYMLREMSAGRYRPEINEEKLPYVLHLEGYIKRRKKKQIAERIAGAINAVKNLGIIKDVEITTGAEGQLKYIFILNSDFE